MSSPTGPLNSEAQRASAVELSNQILSVYQESLGAFRLRVLDTIAERIRESFNATNCAIFWDDELSGTLELVGSSNLELRESPDIPVKVVRGGEKHGGLTSWLATLDKPWRMSFEDLTKEQNSHDKPTQPDHLGGKPRTSLMYAPLFWRRKHLAGFIKLENKRNADGYSLPTLSFSAEELGVLEMLTVPVALVSILRLQSSNERREAIKLVNSGIKGSNNPDDLLMEILDATVALFGADRGDFACWRANKEGGSLVYATKSAHPPPGTSPRVGKAQPVPEGSCVQKVFASSGAGMRDYEIIPDVTVTRERGQDYFPAHADTMSEIAVRVDLFGNPVGVLNIEKFRDKQFFRPEHLPSLRMLAEHAAIALQQVRRDQLFRLAMEESFASEGGADQFPPDNSEILQTILHGFLEAFGFDRGIIFRKDDIANGLAVAASVHDGDIEADPSKFVHKLGGESFAHLVFKQPQGSEPIRVQDAETASASMVDQEARRKWRISGPMFGYPLWFRGECVGAIICWCSKRQYPSLAIPPAPLEEIASLAAARIAFWREQQRRASSQAFFKSLASHPKLIIFTKRITTWTVDDELEGRLPVGVKVEDPKFVFEWGNAAFIDWIGGSDYQGKTDWDLFPNSAVEYYSADLRCINEESPEFAPEWNVCPRDGNRYFVKVWKHRLRHDPIHGECIQVVFFDQTGEKLAKENEAKALAKQERLVRDLKHRVNECIDHVNTLLAEQVDRSSNSGELNDCIIRLQARSAVIARLYGREQGGTVKMKDFIDDIIDCVSKCYQHRHVKCLAYVNETTEFPEDIAIVCGLIVTELVANCYRHGFDVEEHGEIGVHLAPAEPNISWRLAVRDNGHGNAIAWPIHPSSIGLGLVQELVTYHLDGELLQPEPAEPGASSPGLIVAMTFTLKDPPVRPIQNIDNYEQKRVVLLVEDDPTVGPSIKKLLIEHGYAVLGSATDRINAVSYAKNHQPSLIVMDVALRNSEFEGLEAAEEIRSFSNAPILFLTRHDYHTNQIVKARLEIAATDYLLKQGYYREHLLERIETLIARHHEPSTIFICYAHERRNECEELLVALRQITTARQSRVVPVELHGKNSELLISWADVAKIKAGDKWFEKIMHAINRCSVGILLVDQNWLASPFIQEHEFPRLVQQSMLNKKFQFIPVQMERCPLDKNTEVGRALLKIQFWGGTKTTPVDEMGTTEFAVKVQRKRVWAEIAENISEHRADGDPPLS